MTIRSPRGNGCHVRLMLTEMSPMSVTTISPLELGNLLRGGASLDLIDVRTPAEFGEVHLNVARNEPLERLDPQRVWQARGSRTQEPLYVICLGGGRSAQACERFIQAGFTNVISVDGGTRACIAAGLPVTRGKKTISLERQVRIAAGSLVLIGVSLGLLVHPGFFGIAGFVGAGLVFAGITDTCGMGMLLARMPWNQVSAASCARS